MDTEIPGRSRKGVLIAAFMWIGIVFVLAVAGRFFVWPRIREWRAAETGSESQYKHKIAIAADAFSGYAVLRSDAFRKLMKEDGIKAEIVDDKADYEKRMKALRDGDVEMAVYTVDSFITSGAALFEKPAEFPASIVLVIDQTVGGDAVVAYKNGVGKIPDLDRADGKFIMTCNSPSEFLARILVAQFSLPALPEKWYECADGAEAVLSAMKSTDPKAHKAFVLWEPFKSQALQLPDTHVLLDSGKCQDCIVDVLVARREFLADHPDLVEQVVAAYFRALFSYSQRDEDFVQFVKTDAEATGQPLTDELAKNVVAGIQWKRTRENYVHFGIEKPDGTKLQHLEDVIGRVVGYLTKSHALSRDPIGDQARVLFYDGALRALHTKNFHPGKREEVLAGVGPGSADLEAARGASELPPLSADEWKKLSPVGTARVEPIGFRRGTAEINELSQADLDELVKNLGSWPQYYLRILGRARAEGDAEANFRLAGDRAEAVRGYLVSHGVPDHRVQAEAMRPGGADSVAEVGFELLQRPY